MHSRLALVAVLAAALQAAAQQAPAPVILAVGGHAGDMEIAAGAVLAKHSALGHRVVLLHLTLGERGNPKLTPAQYGAQKRKEALAAAKVLGAEAQFGKWADGELPDDEEARRFVAQVIQQVRPSSVITHWRNSMHKDHSRTHAIVRDAVLLASLDGAVPGGARPHRGVRAVYYTDNWEDREGFQPYLAVEIGPHRERWREAVTHYEFIRGGISRFPYLEYYEALARVRGAEAGLGFAETFDVEAGSKRRMLDLLP